MHRRTVLKGLGATLIFTPALMGAIPREFSAATWELTSDGRTLGFFKEVTSSARGEQITLTATGGIGVSDWAQEWAKEARAKKDLHATKWDGERKEKEMNCFGCFPTNFDPGDHRTADDVKTIGITCRVNRIEVV